MPQEERALVHYIEIRGIGGRWLFKSDKTKSRRQISGGGAKGQSQEIRIQHSTEEEWGRILRTNNQKERLRDQADHTWHENARHLHGEPFNNQVMRLWETGASKLQITGERNDADEVHRWARWKNEEVNQVTWHDMSKQRSGVIHNTPTLKWNWPW